MRLWTWQKRGFSLADKESKVESPENSFYLNDPCKAEARCYNRAYKKLWEKLGTCQFHWYFTDEKEAKNEGTCRDNCTNDRLLWEIGVPDDRVFKRVCSIAWNYLLQRQLVPSKLNDYWRYNAPGSKYRKTIEEWEQAFYDFWKSKSEDELWAWLFLNDYVEGCTQVLLRHPLEESWIKKNPAKDDKWWDVTSGDGPWAEPYDDALPCHNCPGRT